jgi:hypothetical protein
MVEVEINCRFTDLAELCEKHVGPRKFYIHNHIGGTGWDVRPGLYREGYKTIARFDNPQIATFIMLKI